MMRKQVLAVMGFVLLLCLLAALGTAVSSPATVTVNSTTDVSDGDTSSITALIANPGLDGVISLREAIQAANNTTGPDTIEFNIDTSDPGYSDIAGTWTISLTASLPTLTGGGTVISGTTQAANVPDSTNLYGPEIETAGAEMASGSCFVISSANNMIHGLVINRCSYSGIFIDGSIATTNTISGNYIGTDASGTQNLCNGWSGVTIWFGAQNNTIGGDTAEERNIISGNFWDGVRIYGGGNTISGNYIGTDAAGSSDLGNNYHGVTMDGGAQNNIIGGDMEAERNIISGNGGHGVLIEGSNGNTIAGNYIGVDASGLSDLGNSWHGVYIISGAQNNTIGGDTPTERNIIAFNGLDGVKVDGASTTSNTITQNSIHSNMDLGIELVNGGNIELAPPTIAIADCFSTYSGTAPSNATVELFIGPDDEGKTYLVTTPADSDGNWSVIGSFALDTYVTATATDASGNSSEFSAAVPPGTCYQISLPLIMKNY